MMTNTGASQLRVVKGGSSYLSQSELTLTFGLGKAGGVKSARLQIVWPSGQKETLADVKPNQVVTAKEGKGILSAAPINFTAVPPR
jgi:hypothetical protein